jgi:pyruvate ferredoxin oxidoreductase beta subunit
VPWIHTAFENSAAMMSGVEALIKVKQRKNKNAKKVKCIATGGDGGTYDIGIQSLSAAMERGHDLLYICYDNGAYMNTGIQRSGATPLGAATTTTPVGSVIAGKQQHRKDLTSIMVAHHIPYVAQASIHDPVDLSNKIQKGIEIDGPAFLNILCPCIPGWRIAPDMAVESAKLGVDTCFWPLFEVIDQKYKINYTPKEKLPITDWLFTQGRFRHLKDAKWAHLVEEFQTRVDEQWQSLQEQAK